MWAVFLFQGLSVPGAAGQTKLQHRDTSHKTKAQIRSFRDKGNSRVGVRTKGEVQEEGQERLRNRKRQRLLVQPLCMCLFKHQPASFWKGSRKEGAPCPVPTEVIKTRNWLVVDHLWIPSLQVGPSSTHPPAYRNLLLQKNLSPQDFSWQQDNKGDSPKSLVRENPLAQSLQNERRALPSVLVTVKIGPDSQRPHRLRGVMLELPHVQSQKKRTEVRGQRSREFRGVK